MWSSCMAHNSAQEAPTGPKLQSQVLGTIPAWVAGWCFGGLSPGPFSVECAYSPRAHMIPACVYGLGPALSVPGTYTHTHTLTHTHSHTLLLADTQTQLQTRH